MKTLKEHILDTMFLYYIFWISWTFFLLLGKV